MKRIGVIGAGLSSLYAACKLGKSGFQVTVFEKNKMVGGRSQTFESEGFVFDMGPSWYWMPELIDRMFEEIGEKREDYYSLHRLDPSYRVFWENVEKTDVPAKLDALKVLFDSFETDGGEKLEKFLKAAAVKYKVAVDEFLENPGLSITELLKVSALAKAVKLDVFKSVEKDVYKRFSSSKARSILTFPVLFLGAMPDKIPSLYTMMNYADLSLGTWYPEGGMSALAKALQKIAEANNVTFQFNANVEKIEDEGGNATAIWSNGERYAFDAIISGADYHHTEQHLLPKKYRKYDSKYWDSRKLAPSSLIFYLGVDRKVDGLKHHNLFFDEDLKTHGKRIYDNPGWPEKPLFYVCAPSKTDKEVAPEGKENLFILVPVAPDLNDEEETRDKYLNIILQRIHEHTGEDIKDAILFKRSFCVSDFKSEYNAYKGNAYGLANTLKQTANLKPKIKSSLNHLYYCGQLTVPGPGVPPALISGKIAANLAMKEL
jgi:phytoene desaturase